MIANSEINENGIVFSDSFSVGPAGFIKNQLPTPHSPLPFFENFIIPSKMRQGDWELC